MKTTINLTANLMFVFAFVTMALVAAPIAAHAADLSLDDGSGGWVTDSATPYYGSEDNGGSWVTDSATPYYAPQDNGGSWVTDSATPYYGYDTGSYSPYGYSTGGYSTGGYSTGGYSTGGYSTGGGYVVSTPSYHAPAPVYSTPSYSSSNVYAPTTVTTNNNSCTNNSCNHDDHSVVNISNPAPVINNVVANYGSTNTTQYCASGYYGTYPNCYLNNNQPPVVYQRPVVAYAATPYVSLSQVPYTGLDLGFWGTIAYWGFIVGFALVVAYLVAIKRVQNTIALKLKHFLFGSDEIEEATVVATSNFAPAKVTTVEYVSTKAQSSEDTIDSFIMSQVNRPRHA